MQTLQQLLGTNKPSAAFWAAESFVLAGAGYLAMQGTLQAWQQQRDDFQEAVRRAVQDNSAVRLTRFAQRHGTGMLELPLCWQGPSSSIMLPALDYAILDDATVVIEWLLNQGAQPAALRAGGHSPLTLALYRAATAGSLPAVSMVLLLLSYWPADALPSRLAYTGAQVPAVGWGTGIQQQGESLDDFHKGLAKLHTPVDLRRKLDFSAPGWVTVPVAGPLSGIKPAKPQEEVGLMVLVMLLPAAVAMLLCLWEATAVLRT